MVSFHNDQRLKDELLELLTVYQFDKRIGDSTHEDSPAIGSGFECILQCETKDPHDYSYFETKYGIPSSIAMLESDLFYYLPKERQLDWPTVFVDAISVGIDLSGVIPGLIQKIWFKKRLSIFSLCPPDKKYVFIPMKTRLLLMQLYSGAKSQGLPTLFVWDDLPEWQSLDEQDMKGDIILRKLLIRIYGIVRYAQWGSDGSPNLIPLLSSATQLFEHVAKQNACHKVCFNQELYKREGIAGINRHCLIEGDLYQKQIKAIVQHLYAYDLLDVLKQQEILCN